MTSDREPEKGPALYRSHVSNLSDDELLILDVMFACSVTQPMLRSRNILPQFNHLPHELTDEALRVTLARFIADGVIEQEEQQWRDEHYLSMTSLGGELWASERCPTWDRYCTESYLKTIRGRSIVSVKCVSADVRDDFLRLWPEFTARIKRATIADYGLIHWRNFGRIHVGLASYAEPPQQTTQESQAWLSKHLAYLQRVESERSWWRTVNELQKFVN